MDRWTGFEQAPALAAELLGPDSVRYHHVAGVAAAAARASAAVPADDVDLLVAAAWLHDIGYASSLIDTGSTHWTGHGSCGAWGRPTG